MKLIQYSLIVIIALISSYGMAVSAQVQDEQVRQVLEDNKGKWRDMNVPGVDGQAIYNLILEYNYTRALEIGTSTGHSTIWIAWALSKTGGKLITMELDSRRQKIARANIEAAGLSDYVDFRLGNAHDMVPALTGEYDFVFSDADKDWYIQYFKDMHPKLTADACFAAHNVKKSLFGWRKEYLKFLEDVEDMDTTLNSSGSGIAITCKKT